MPRAGYRALPVVHRSLHLVQSYVEGNPEQPAFHVNAGRSRTGARNVCSMFPGPDLLIRLDCGLSSWRSRRPYAEVQLN